LIEVLRTLQVRSSGVGLLETRACQERIVGLLQALAHGATDDEIAALLAQQAKDLLEWRKN
jgi:hypothetical protein